MSPEVYSPSAMSSCHQTELSVLSVQQVKMEYQRATDNNLYRLPNDECHIGRLERGDSLALPLEEMVQDFDHCCASGGPVPPSSLLSGAPF